jgi:hypothetical protein
MDIFDVFSVPNAQILVTGDKSTKLIRGKTQACYLYTPLMIIKEAKI